MTWANRGPTIQGPVFQEEFSLTCPNCRAAVRPGQAICPKCDHIIDSSFAAVPEETPSELAEPMGRDEGLDPEALASELGQTLRSLHGPQAFVFWSAAVSAFFCCLPWKQTAQEGDLIGVIGLGSITFVASALTAGSVISRARASGGARSSLRWTIQFLICVFAFLWTGLCIWLASGTAAQPSRPAFGAFLALLSTALAMGGTLYQMGQGL